MRRTVPALALLCILVGCGVAAWKVLVLGWSFSPATVEDRFEVQLSVRASGRGEKARLHLGLPSGAALLRVDNEQFTHPGLRLSVLSKARGRVATFTSDAERAQGPLEATYRFTVRVPRRDAEVPVPPKPASDDALPSDTLPSADPAVVATAKELTQGAADDTARVRNLYDFLVDEVSAERDPADELPAEAALTTLAEHRGPALARVRLFVALCRSLGLPARVVRAVPLAEGIDRPLVTRAEVFADGGWIAIDPVRGRFGRDADGEGFPLLRGDGALARGEGLDGVTVQVSVTRESVNELEIAQRRAEGGSGLFDRLSFLALPPRTQLVFRVLLLVPLGALLVAFFRNFVGVPTHGTFMPILVALALRETRPVAGAVLLGLVVAVGLAGRAMLDRLRLLIVPRLAVLLSFVIFTMAAVALFSARLGLDDGLAIALLPMVIMTMTIERLSVQLAEEGLRPALRTLAGTMLVATAGYAVFQSEILQRTVFAFPELNLLVVALLLLLGRYTGYRLSELVRFRALLARRENPAPAPEVE